MIDILNFFYKNLFYNDNIIFFKILMVIFLLLWFIKKLFLKKFQPNSTLIRIITQTKIDKNNKVIVVDIQNIRLILGATLHNIRTLHIIPVVKNKIYSYRKNKKSKIFLSFLKKTIYQFFVFMSFMCYSSNVYSAEFSEITKHIFLHNIYHWSFTTQFFLLTLLLTLVSAVVLMTTSFTRIIIVLSLLRNALGTPTLPPNQLLIGIALCLTCFVMYPTYHQIYQEAYLPFYASRMSFDIALTKFFKLIYNFMLHQTRQSDLLVFSKLSHISLCLKKDIIPIQILLPSFIISELKTAFQIGFTIFLPFLVIDLFTATVLMALGMTMISPNTISLPIKLILFVMVDGWQLVCSSLVRSFY